VSPPRKFYTEQMFDLV